MAQARPSVVSMRGASLTRLHVPLLRVGADADALGVVLAYGVGEATKMLPAQTRPCIWLLTTADCPSGVVSLPSNHATLTFGVLWVIAFAGRQLGNTIVVLAGLRVDRRGSGSVRGRPQPARRGCWAPLGLVVAAPLTLVVTAWQSKRRGDAS